MTRFALIGCGNIGSRHLQALAKLPFSADIEIVEPNKTAKEIAISRLNEIKHGKTNHNYIWLESIKDLKNQNDLVIVATNSVGRSDLVVDLLERGNSKFLIEKVVCQSVDEYEKLLSAEKKFNAKIWVNTNRRYFQAYQRIKEYFGDSKMLHLSVIGSNPRLGTSAIHYIDLFSWLSNSYKIKLSGEFLLDKIFPNKRGEQFVEFAGTMIGSSDNGELTLTFLPDGNLPNTINIVANDKHLLVDETNEKVFDLMKKGEGDFEFKFEHASSLTIKIVEDILQKDDCLLPRLEDLSYSHFELFRIFNEHIKKVINEERKLCPIT